MPKRTANRPISERGEKNLAERIRRERRQRRWSYEALAQEMTRVGCPISKAALYSIEQDPPRRITVDELVAFSEVFGFDIANLLTPIPLLNQKHAHELIDLLSAARREVRQNIADLMQGLFEVEHIADVNEELSEYVKGHLESLKKVDFEECIFPAADEGDAEWLVELRLTKAFLDLVGSVGSAASDYLDQVKGRGADPSVIEQEIASLSAYIGWPADTRPRD